jgi:type I restriction enzyme M protein
MADYTIFMAMVDKIGHDKRGNPIFMRDKEGNELLVPDSDDTNGDGTSTLTHKVKQIDDQTPYIPRIFAEWKRKEGIAW